MKSTNSKFRVYTYTPSGKKQVPLRNQRYHVVSNGSFKKQHYSNHKKTHQPTNQIWRLQRATHAGDFISALGHLSQAFKSTRSSIKSFQFYRIIASRHEQLSSSDLVKLASQGHCECVPGAVTRIWTQARTFLPLSTCTFGELCQRNTHTRLIDYRLPPLSALSEWIPGDLRTII